MPTLFTRISYQDSNCFFLQNFSRINFAWNFEYIFHINDTFYIINIFLRTESLGVIRIVTKRVSLRTPVLNVKKDALLLAF